MNQRLESLKALHQTFCAAMNLFNVERRRFQKEIQKELDREFEIFLKGYNFKTTKYNYFIVNFDGGCMTTQWEADAFVSSIHNNDGENWKSYDANRDGTWTLTTSNKDFSFNHKKVQSGPCPVRDLENFCERMSKVLDIRIYIFYGDDKGLLKQSPNETDNEYELED